MNKTFAGSNRYVDRRNAPTVTITRGVLGAGGKLLECRPTTQQLLRQTDAIKVEAMLKVLM